MKNLSFLVVMFGIISLSQAQKSVASLEDVMADDNEVTVLNREYLTSVQQSETPADAKFLEGIVSQWDATSSLQFDGRNKLFKTRFNSNKGSAEVSYDNKGAIVSTKEVFRDVSLPTQIKQVLFQRYQDWNIIQSKYYVTYNIDKAIIKYFEITIENGDEQKRIKINAV